MVFFSSTSVELNWPVAAFLEGCAVALVAWSAPRGRTGAIAAAAVSIAAVLLPILVPSEPRIARAVVSFVGILCMMRNVDLWRGARQGSFSRRVWFVVAPFDIRQASFARSAFDVDRALAMGGYASLAALSVFTLLRLQFTESAPLLITRWFVGAVLCYSAVDTAVAATSVGYRLAGIVTPEIHRSPVLSKSVREFWSKRWNRPVHEWLFRHCFMPLARRGSPNLGIAAAFAAATIIHSWMTIFGAGKNMAPLVGAFFLLQPLLLLLEGVLGVARWPALAARIWTVGSLLATSPLFVEPALRLIGL